MIQHACILKYRFTEQLLINLSEENPSGVVMGGGGHLILLVASGFQALKRKGLKS